MAEKNYDSTIARIAGNILAGVNIPQDEDEKYTLASEAVALAQAIIEAIKNKGL